MSPTLRIDGARQVFLTALHQILGRGPHAARVEALFQAALDAGHARHALGVWIDLADEFDLLEERYRVSARRLRGAVGLIAPSWLTEYQLGFPPVTP